MEYKQNWKFEIFQELIIKKENKQKFYDMLYKNSSEEIRKRLFLFLNHLECNKEINKLLDKDDCFITQEGLRKYLFVDKDIFNSSYKFQCTNNECRYYDQVFESEYVIPEKCPECSTEKMIFINKNKLKNTLEGLFLNYYDFYLISDFDKTVYLIHNKFANKYYLKGSDESFSNWIYLKLLENGCNIDKYLFALCGTAKNAKNVLLKYIKQLQLIKTIDNINFKPIKEYVFKEDNKSYFNIYSGNENLNKILSNKKLEIFEDCPNIHELLYNLTGKDVSGIEYLLDVLAMIVQEPHIKTKQLIIFYGEEASGKGTFYDLILKPLFEGYITKILGKKIKSSFNGFMSKNLILVLEEVKADKDEEDTLKELVTEEFLLINEKGLPERYENNYLTIFGFSNEQNPISAGKRRGVYFRSRTLGGTTEKSPEYRKKFEENIPLEFENFLNIIKNRHYNRVEVMKGFETEAKQQVLEQNMSMIERFYEELCNFSNLDKYVSEQIDGGFIEFINLNTYSYKFKEIHYIQAELLLMLYNGYLKKQKYNIISLNKFSQFWQLTKIDRDNKDHWRRLINPINEKKTQYVNLNIINGSIKRNYEAE